VTSKATTVEEYLAELPADRRDALNTLRAVIAKSLDKGFAEQMQYGMISWVVPHKLYPPGYHCDPKQPLPFASLASQKNYVSLYLHFLYQMPEQEQWLREQFQAAGKKLDLGKCCLRFKKMDDVPLHVVGEAVARLGVADFIQVYEDALKTMAARKK
jgi:hypothetical protein